VRTGRPAGLMFFLFNCLSLCFLLLWDWGLNSGLPTCKAGSPSLEPGLQFISLWLFWRWGLTNYLPSLASYCHPPDLSLPSSWDHRREPLRLMAPSYSRGRWCEPVHPATWLDLAGTGTLSCLRALGAPFWQQ
jgi:hypothetical protein